MFDKEVLAAAGLEVVDELSTGGDGSQEERLLQAMGTNFRKLRALHHARLDKPKSRMAAVDKAEADLKVRVTETQTWFRQACEEPPTGLIHWFSKTEGNTYATIAASPFPL